MKTKLFFVCSLLLCLSCNRLIEKNTDAMTIVAGTSKITGKIILPEGKNKDSIMITLNALHPILGENNRHEVLADQSGKFSLNFDVDTETSLIGLYTSIEPNKVLLLKPKNNDSTHIDIVYDVNLDFKNVEVTPAVNMSKYDMRQSMEVVNKMIDYRSKNPNAEYPRLYDKSIDEFLDYAKNNVAKKMALFVDNDNLLSKETKGLIAKEYSLLLYTGHIFGYEAEMKRNYHNATQDRDGKPEIQKIDRSYFRFLKDFNLNDPQYLHTFSFPEFQDSILQNEVLGLPKIGESDIPYWLTEVKAILADLVGFDQGPYYDILAANAYGLQLREEARPLTEKQKENITHYWNNGEIAKILFRKNQQVVELNKTKSPAVINDVASIAPDKIMETIRSNYKDKVVCIDLWATWCAPCLGGIKQFSTVKGEFHDKDVVFVYITNGSSPKKLWEEKIKGIGNEHYYLTDAQWEYTMEQFGFDGIPSYLLYDQKGLLFNKFTGFPGNDAMKGMINALITK